MVKPKWAGIKVTAGVHILPNSLITEKVLLTPSNKNVRATHPVDLIAIHLLKVSH
jgi:hypothetical protein